MILSSAHHDETLESFRKRLSPNSFHQDMPRHVILNSQTESETESAFQEESRASIAASRSFHRDLFRCLEDLSYGGM